MMNIFSYIKEYVKDSITLIKMGSGEYSIESERAEREKIAKEETIKKSKSRRNFDFIRKSMF